MLGVIFDQVFQMRIAELWTEMFIQSEVATAVEEEGAMVLKARGKPCNHQASKYGSSVPLYSIRFCLVCCAAS